MMTNCPLLTSQLVHYLSSFPEGVEGVVVGLGWWVDVLVTNYAHACSVLANQKLEPVQAGPNQLEGSGGEVLSHDVARYPARVIKINIALPFRLTCACGRPF
jgi:hypothetical protein